MKRYIYAVLAAAVLSPVLSAVVRAQDEAAPPPPPPPAERAEGHHDGMGARMKEKLGLTDEQSGKFQDAMKAHGDAMKQQGEQMRATVKKLAGQIKATAKDEDILATLGELKSERKAMAEENEKFEESLSSILTPIQRAKMAVGVAREMNRRREEGRGKGGRGGGRDGGGDRDGDHDGHHGGDDNGQ